MSCYFCFVLLPIGPEEMVSVMLYSLYVLCVALVNRSVCFVCCVFDSVWVKQFAICLGVLAILLLKVMELLCVVGGALLDRPCMGLQ